MFLTLNFFPAQKLTGVTLLLVLWMFVFIYVMEYRKFIRTNRVYVGVRQADGDNTTVIFFNQTGGLPADQWVFLLSYQRTGSSYVGGIFQDPARIFYVYEPIDPLYSAMYGTEDGWNVPSDIFSNRNGSLRAIPEDELQATYWLMEKIYTCQMSSLPPAILAHKFWSVFNTFMSHTSGYLSCLRKRGIDYKGALIKCQRHIRSDCGQRFRAVDLSRQQKCKKYLWGNDMKNSDYYEPRCTKNRANVETNLPLHFQQYYTCLSKMNQALTQCAAEHFDAPCREKSIKAVKTVRGNMRVADKLMHDHDNLYVVHQFRDPRGAVRSRVKATWSQGLHSHGSSHGSIFAQEAKLYCTQVLDDIHRRQHLEDSPGLSRRIRQQIYDGFTMEPLLNMLDTYHFLGQNASEAVKRKFAKNRYEKPSKQSESIAKKWEKTLKPSEIEVINKECATLMKEVEFDWSKH